MENLESPKEKLQKYLPAAESFLSSVLHETSRIEIVSDDMATGDDVIANMEDTDIFLYVRDKENQADIILVLDKEWYALLSKIMLGVEEKSGNEITRDLLREFSSELTVTLKKQLMRDGVSPNPADIQVLTLKQTGKQLVHEEYYHFKLKVGVPDDRQVRAELLIGNPNRQREVVQGEETGTGKKPGAGKNSGADRDPESRKLESRESDVRRKPEDRKDRKGQKSGAGAERAVADRETGTGWKYGRGKIGVEGSGQAFSPVSAREMSAMGAEEKVISGRHIEFEEFEEDSGEQNGNSTRSIDLLKDVEMDVSVELGRIELPLGKVLELAKGSVIELEKLAGEPVDILVNGHRIAYGEVVVIDEHFGVRISNLITTRQRLAQLR